KAVYDYSSPHDDDLNFPNGQIITVTEQEDDDWYVGEYTDASGEPKSGLFPKNFVEKYEPPLPSRPNRASRVPTIPVQSPTSPQEEFPSSHAPEPAAPQPVREEPALHAAPELTEEEPPAPPTLSKPAPRAAEPLSELPHAPKPAPAKAAVKEPPEVSEKPSSFKDRIAAFNKQAAAPPVPFKPSGGGPGTGFIKKPFVAPPPSRNAFVPPPRENVPAQKVYRREEDPEIQERVAEEQESAEKAGLAPANAGGAEEQDEDAPKPMSLKERMALLQKEQMAQAARRADVAHKEKPKKPPKKRTESQEPVGRHEEEGADLERIQSGDATERGSTDMDRETARATSAHRPPKVPQAPKQPEPTFSDGNDADQSAAGEMTEQDEGFSTVDEDAPRTREPHLPGTAPAPPAREPDVGGEEDITEEEEEEEEDPEAKRKRELSERMARLGRGVGPGMMFGGMPMPGMGGAPPPPKRQPARISTDEPRSPESVSSPQRMPMVPVPGMGRTMSHESEATTPMVEKEYDDPRDITTQRPPEEVPDVEDIKPQAPPRASLDRGAPPVPQ
ncbi:hypothetical protein LTS18_011007, partial [Coniosporium uncinatum]